MKNKSLLMFLFLAAGPGFSQQLHVLHRFSRGPEAPAAALIQGQDEFFYGTTYYGGRNNVGTVIKIDSLGNLVTLHSFGGPGDGAYPAARLILATDGNFYGTTIEGGTNNNGTVFKMDPSGVVTVLHSFSGTPDGMFPEAGLIQGSDGNLYGTTSKGGTNGLGAIYRSDLFGNISVVHSFTGEPMDGSNPQSPLIQGSDGNFYGTSSNGGAANAGTVYKSDRNGNVAVLYSFSGQADGAVPRAALLEGSDGMFYGTTHEGGVNSLGTVFKIDPTLGLLMTVHSFAAGSVLAFDDGAYPEAELIGANDGNFYGTTSSGGTNNFGVVFKMDSSGNVSTLHSFVSNDGAILYAGLVQAKDGNLYGTTFEGGPHNFGSVFEVDLSGNLTLLSTFTSAEGQTPVGALIQASDGKFYGVTRFGGENEAGALFSMDSSGAVTTIHSFNGDDGAYPQAGLIQASDGNFYGTTQWGGQSGFGLGNGTIFRSDALGNVTVLHSFTGAQLDGAYSHAVLIQDNGGNFYGTTERGGFSDRGAVFKMDSSGNMGPLQSFTGPPAGDLPRAGLIQASDGNFYGTTLQGGTNNLGSVFRMDQTGNITVIHSFAGKPADGAYPQAGLIQGTDGNLYGTSYNGGTADSGTLFKMHLSGNLSVLHSFTGSDGAFPSAALIQTSDGDLYGTTYAGGPSDSGTAFRLNSSNNLTTVHAFSGSDGANPDAELIEASDGNLYGTTSSGTTGADLGTIFRIDIQPVTLVAAVSRKTHGSAGIFDINLPVGGNVGIECRSGGPDSEYTIVFTFANPLTSVDGARVTGGTGFVANSSIDSNDAHNYIVALGGVTNAQIITVALSNVADGFGSFSGAVSAQMGLLLGDVNASRRVDAADVSSVRQQTLQTITTSNFREDVNASGRIDAADVSIARQQTLTFLP